MTNHYIIALRGFNSTRYQLSKIPIVNKGITKHMYAFVGQDNGAFVYGE